MSLSPDIERSKPREVKPLLPGHRLLFPNPGFLFGAAGKMTMDEMGLVNVRFKDLPQERLDRNAQILGEEYFYLLGLLREHIGADNIVIVRNRIIMLKDLPDSDFRDVHITHYPDLSEFESVDLSVSQDHPSIWTRDGFSTIGDITFVNPKFFSGVDEDEKVISSSLGEGGSVLVAGNAVLVSENLWIEKNQDRGFNVLKRLGFTVAPLPPVDPNKQKYVFINESHIDCHAALIIDPSGKLHLLVAESYSRQGNGTRKRIRFAADTIGAKVFEVDDRNLPPLALNFIQLADKTAIVTGSETADLTFVLDNILGANNVRVTSVPLLAIPAMLAGSIRCMTNTIPESLLNQLKTKA